MRRQTLFSKVAVNLPGAAYMCAISRDSALRSSEYMLVYILPESEYCVVIEDEKFCRLLLKELYLCGGVALAAGCWGSAGGLGSR